MNIDSTLERRHGERRIAERRCIDRRRPGADAARSGAGPERRSGIERRNATPPGAGRRLGDRRSGD